MTVVRVEPLGAALTVEDGESIFAAAYRAGYQWPTMCKGMARCGACTLAVVEGAEQLSDMTDVERDMLIFGFGGLEKGGWPLRMACQTSVNGPGVVVGKRGVVPLP